MTSLALPCSLCAGVLASLMLSLVGCTEVSEGRVPLELTVWSGFGQANKVVGMTVCGPDATNCVTTDPNAKATLALPANKPVTWTMTKEGEYGSILIGDVTDETFVWKTGVIVPADSWMKRVYGEVGSPYPFPDTASVFIWTDVPDATFNLLDAEGRQFYSDAIGEPDTELDATTSTGTGGFIEVEVGPDEVGEVLVEIGGAAAGCDLNWGWRSDANDTIRMPVRRGFTTYAAVTCD